MPPARSASQQADTTPTSVAVLVTRMDNVEKRMDEKFADLREYLDEKFADVCRVTSDHEARLKAAEKEISEIRPVSSMTKWAAGIFGGMLLVLVWAIITHTIELVVH